MIQYEQTNKHTHTHTNSACGVKTTRYLPDWKGYVVKHNYVN